MLSGKIGYFRATAHPEALAWRTRVIANGGTVSASTFTAVDAFCKSIDAAGLRSLLWRVNPMAGGNLSAALVPLYRGPSSGSLNGNATDTNANFVSGDYSEATGLIGNNSNKTLDTGLPQNFATNRHIGVVPYTTGTTAFRYFAGARSSGFAALTAMYISSPVTRVGIYNYNDAGSAAGGGGEADIVSRRLAISVSDASNSQSGARTYSNAIGGATGAALSTTNATTIAIFAIKQDGGTFNGPTNARIAGYTIGNAMTAAQVATYNGIWTNLLTALGRVEPQVSNADAQSWINRVYDNGGTVSTTTANAVNDFCNAIDAAGIRDRFMRLNLFAGSGLAAALVPLYRGPSLGGTQFGNSTDTNANFVAGDYVETSGLIGNGSSKVLDTGLPVNFAAARHAGAFVHTLPTTTFRSYIGANGATTFAGLFSLENESPATVFRINTYSDASSAGGATGGTHASGDFVIASANVEDGRTFLQANGAATGATGLNQSSGAVATSISVFARRTGGGSYASYINARLGGYTIGIGMSPAQATTYYNIWDTLLRALGRK